MNLPGGWKVVEKVASGPAATGGCFSQGYVVEGADGQRAFLKALDYSWALQSEDPAMVLQAMTAAYLFERDVLRRCGERGLDRVVRAITDGTVTVEAGNPSGVVQYLIFELADGDVRAQMAAAGKLSLAWLLRSLHHVATGLMQLHRQGIAHQDVKPSNVLVFAKTYSKVGDLGRAAVRGQQPPHEDEAIPGDPWYAPPELLYGAVPLEWNARRFGCDAYLLGSMISFMLTGIGITALLIAELPDSHRPGTWTGTYTEVLPEVRDAFDRALQRLSEAIPEPYRADLLGIVRELCDPEPALRGHPKNRKNAAIQYSLERYVTRFDLLAKKAEYALGKAVA
jgi:serine/threonine protein kinase